MPPLSNPRQEKFVQLAVVPIEPTRSMLEAGHRAALGIPLSSVDYNDGHNGWHSALAVAYNAMVKAGEMSAEDVLANYDLLANNTQHDEKLSNAAPR